jgi:hypothetical protein
MAKLNFLYQLPWGFNLSGFGNIRQGYTTRDYIWVPAPERGTVWMGNYMAYYLEKAGDSHLPTFYNVDLSLTKDVRLKNAGTITLCIDAFNVFNFSHALSRESQVNYAGYYDVTQILNPRVIRFGIRYQF